MIIGDARRSKQVVVDQSTKPEKHNLFNQNSYNRAPNVIQTSQTGNIRKYNDDKSTARPTTTQQAYSNPTTSASTNINYNSNLNYNRNNQYSNQPQSSTPTTTTTTQQQRTSEIITTFAPFKVNSNRDFTRDSQRQTQNCKSINLRFILFSFIPR